MSEPSLRRPKTPFTLSPTAAVGPFLTLGGVMAEGPRRAFLGGDVALQTERVLETLQSRLADLNATLADAMAIHVYLRDAGDFSEMNDVYRRYWSMNLPTRTTVVAGLRHPDARVEMSATVVAKDEPREIIQPRTWSPPPNPYSYAVRSGRTLFLSGLVPRDPRTATLIAGDVRTQTEAVMENARELLTAADMTFADIASVRISIPTEANFAAMHAVYRQYFPVEPPACTTLVTPLMNAGFQVEITMLAVKAKYRLTMPAAPEQEGMHLSAFVQAEGRLFVSGMRGDSPETRNDVAGQTQEAARRLTRVLRKARFTWKEVRELSVYLSDVEHASAVMHELAPFLPVVRRPTGAIVQTGLMAPGALIEIGMICSRDRWRWK